MKFLVIIAVILTLIIISVTQLVAYFEKKKYNLKYNNMLENSQKQNGNPVIIVQENKSNGVGTAGFILALIGLIFCWIPVINWILWILGAILSIVGCFKEPRGLAIAGVVISFIGVILLIVVVIGLASLV
ncbi:MAG: hypothetical protein LBP63_01125 [Prevotellaceae bacterium]|jgi:hypothetical protein|nr:hypothetical protein [Prevotellaceae bacterium]